MTLVTLTTDFGLSDPFVGIMKGVIAGRAPTAPVIDVTHDIPPQDVLAGALVLRHAVPYFPAGAIHVAVVDPGVGTERRPLCIETARGFLVGPDNGLLSLAARDVRRIIHLTDERFFLTPRSATFHGRDVFAPVAAALASGTAAPALGVEVQDMHRLAVPEPVVAGRAIRGQVLYIDRFGNLVSNVGRDTIDRFRAALTIRVGRVSVRNLSASYAAVAPEEPVAVVNSWGLVEVAVRNGSARERAGAGVGDPLVIEAD